MTRLILGSVAACLLAAQPGQSDTPGVDRTDSAQQSGTAEIRELESATSRAILAGDVDFFDRTLADDFTHTSASGRLRTKAEWMQGRKPGQTPYVSYEIENLKVRLYGDVAVVTGLAKAEWKENDEVESGRYQIIRVWAKRDGQWKAVAFQSTNANNN